MVHVVIKPDRARDEYVLWSTNVESLIAWGNRAEMEGFLAEDHERDGRAGDPPADRLMRADLDGSSAYPEWGFMHWDRHELIYEQRGFLPRRHLYRAAELLGEDRQAEVWDLLEPLDDDEPVRRG